MALKIIPIAICFVIVLFAMNSKHAVEGFIGMTWGRQSAQRLIPSTVVDLLLQNGMKEARIFSSEDDILKAFIGSGINLTISIYNLKNVTTQEDANIWVQNRAQFIETADIRRIIIGDSPFYKGLMTNKSTLDRALNGVEYMQNALNTLGYSQVKVTLPFGYRILKDNITRPSEAEFRDEKKDQVLRFLRFNQANRAPLVIEFFPIHYVTRQKLDLSFAFPDNKSTLVIQDVNGAVYTNAFEFVYDSFVWALHKLNASDLEMLVGQIGWPTDGYYGANASAAEYFYKHFLPLVASNNGTPMRPRKPVDVFVHCLTDENRNPYEFPFTRHWGIYRSNGEPKYKIDMLGQGRDIFPAKARGIMRMPARWCVVAENVTNKDAVLRQEKKACDLADCTSLAPGGSCSQLDFDQRVSYAFNMYFQATFQREAGCRFEGYGRVVDVNPSTNSCVFPVEPVQGQQIQMDLVSMPSDNGGRLRRMPPEIILWLSVLWALFF